MAVERIRLRTTEMEECAEKQRRLREHIDGEFIDINGYMLDLVQNCPK